MTTSLDITTNFLLVDNLIESRIDEYVKSGRRGGFLNFNLPNHPLKSTLPKEELHIWAHSHCAVFASALHEHFESHNKDSEIVALKDFEGEITHFMVKSNNLYWDAYGSFKSPSDCVHNNFESIMAIEEESEEKSDMDDLIQSVAEKFDSEEYLTYDSDYARYLDVHGSCDDVHYHDLFEDWMGEVCQNYLHSMGIELYVKKEKNRSLDSEELLPF